MKAGANQVYNRVQFVSLIKAVANVSILIFFTCRDASLARVEKLRASGTVLQTIQIRKVKESEIYKRKKMLMTL